MNKTNEYKSNSNAQTGQLLAIQVAEMQVFHGEIKVSKK